MPNQVLPISSTRSTRNGKSNFTNPIPDSVVSSIACSVRFGPQHKLVPIGYVQSISFDMRRDVEEYYEITSYPSPKFGSIDALFNEMSFNDSIAYDGEPASIFPGIAHPIDVLVQRPMIYSSNILEAVFKSSASGEFTNGTEDDFRFTEPPETDTFKDVQDALKRGLIGAGIGAAAGLLRPPRPGQSSTDAAIEGALGGALYALMPRKEYTADRARYGSLLQQVRPLEMSVLIYSPNRRNKVVYGLHFINGWSNSWKISNISANSGAPFLMEDLTIKFERVRTILPK